MGKKLIIPGADFSANAISIATFKTVNPNTSFQIKDSTVKNVQSDSNGIYEFEGYINFTGSSSAINLFNNANGVSNTNIQSIKGLRLKSSGLQYCFARCGALKGVVFSDIDVSGDSINLFRLFYYCGMLENVIFPKSKRIKADVSLNGMFDGCPIIKAIDLSMIDTQNVTSMSGFLKGASGEYTAIEELNLSGWNLRSFDVSVASSYQYAFLHASLLKKVIVNDCDASTITKLKTILATSGLTYTEGTDSEGNAVLIGA